MVTFQEVPEVEERIQEIIEEDDKDDQYEDEYENNDKLVATKSSDNDDSDIEDSDSNDIDIEDILKESILDRIIALVDIIPPKTRFFIRNGFNNYSRNIYYFGMSHVT